MPTDVSRRGFLGGMTAAAWLTASWAEVEGAGAFAAAATPQDPYKLLSTEQVRLLDAASAQIVPTDNLPGAREARVVRFMDRALSTFAKDQWPAMQQALKDLAQVATNWSPGKSTFLELNESEQIGVLEEMERNHPESFGIIRGMTLTGMVSNPEYGGNYGKAGWKMIGFPDKFGWLPPFGYYDRG